VTESWMASNDDEYWSNYEEYASREEAAKHAHEELDLEPGQTFFTARKVDQPIDDLVTPGLAEHFARSVNEVTCENLESPLGEDWLDLDADEKKALARLLSTAFKAFIEAHPRHKPEWFLAKDVEEHEAPGAET